MNIKYKSRLTLIFLTVFLTACGGGGSSSSGSSADKVVTQCIRAESVDIVNVEFNESRYTNTCDFTVSLGYKKSIGADGPFTLPPNATHSDLLGYIASGNVIACRPPSQATNRGTNLDVRLDCT